jgi:asparagine synthase (glutamine-hydrolysing)
MCGIAGIVAPAADQYSHILQQMLTRLRHRGPDDEGTHFFPLCALGHTRLGIVDLKGGRQPMLTPNRRAAISFNGEIYGFKALRPRFPLYPFQTTGDTELILAMYERHGQSLPECLPGMFAFAIWDEENQRLFCARDRFGEKPFFYAEGRNGEFVFASEIKAILVTGLVEAQSDSLAIRQFLRRGYVHGDRTIFHNIRSLPPAHRLTYADGQIQISRYWSLPPVDRFISLSDAVEEFRHLFDQSIARQMVADVPVGAFLSGGLDSSTIVAVAARQHQRLKTFSFGFGKAINELPYAREIAACYQTDHYESSDQLEDIAGLLLRMSEVYDEPFGDSSNIPTYLVSREARKHVTVALAGEGADELLAGYNYWYRPLFNLERASRLPDFVATLIRIAAGGCKIMGRPLPRPLSELWEGFFMKPHHRNCLDAHRGQTAYFTEAELDGLGLPLDAEASIPYAPTKQARGLDGILRTDVETYLPGDVLTKTDRASMAWSLEIRCPFLDVDLASFCIGLPSRLKIDARRDKILLREAYGKAWTASIRKRSKQGFGAPVEAWLKQPSLIEMKRCILENPHHSLCQLIDYDRMGPYREKGNYQTWLLLVLGLWRDQHPRAF